MVCNLDGQFYLIDGNGLFIPDTTGPLRVTLSKDGTQLSQEMISASVTTHPCGCGNLTATNRTFHVRLPLPGDGGA